MAFGSENNAPEKNPQGEKTVYIDGIGDVKIVKHPRAKNFRITLRPFEGLRLSIPRRVIFVQALKFIETKRDWFQNWVEKHRGKMESIEKKTRVVYKNGQKVTRTHTIHTQSWATNRISVVVARNKIHVKYPKNLEETPELRKAMEEGINRALRLEARDFLPGRVDELARAFNFKYKQVFLKNLKSRWGSCSSQNNINLNIQLMRIESELIDYVILHELCHTVEKNHSKKFWSLLEKCKPGARVLDKKLNKYALKFA